MADCCTSAVKLSGSFSRRQSWKFVHENSIPTRLVWLAHSTLLVILDKANFYVQEVHCSGILFLMCQILMVIRVVHHQQVRVWSTFQLVHVKALNLAKGECRMIKKLCHLYGIKLLKCANPIHLQAFWEDKGSCHQFVLNKVSVSMLYMFIASYL